MKAVKVLIIALLLIGSGLLSYVLFSQLRKLNEESTVVNEDSSIASSEAEDSMNVKLFFDLSERAYLNEAGKIEVKVNPSLYEVPAIDVVISYDSEMIRVDSIDESSAFSEYLVKEIDEENGLITISAIVPEDTLITSIENVAVINYTALKEGSTTLSYKEGEADNLLTYVSLVSAEATKAPLTLEDLTIFISAKPENSDLSGEDI